MTATKKQLKVSGKNGGVPPLAFSGYVVFARLRRVNDFTCIALYSYTAFLFPSAPMGQSSITPLEVINNLLDNKNKRDVCPGPGTPPYVVLNCLAITAPPSCETMAGPMQRSEIEVVESSVSSTSRKYFDVIFIFVWRRDVFEGW